MNGLWLLHAYDSTSGPAKLQITVSQGLPKSLIEIETPECGFRGRDTASAVLRCQVLVKPGIRWRLLSLSLNNSGINNSEEKEHEQQPETKLGFNPNFQI